MGRSILIVLGVLAVAPLPVVGQSDAPVPCSTAEHRQFDFWLGEWTVMDPWGKTTGTNRISKAFGGCVLHEQYETARGYSGSSFNIYDAARQKWHQTWVDTSGTLLQLDGGLVGEIMILEGVGPGAGGSTARHRITWTPNPDGSVRQLWEATDPAGEWFVVFDGRYVRRTAAVAQTQSEMSKAAFDAFDSARKELTAAVTQYRARLTGNRLVLFDDTQSTWERFRDATCAFQSAGLEGGSARPMVHAQCMEALTRLRLVQINDLANCQEGDLSCPAR